MFFVQSRPGRAACFTAPQPVKRDQLPHRGEPVGRRLVQEHPDVLGRPGFHLGPVVGGQFDAVSRVEGDHPLCDRIVERALEHCVSVGDRRQTNGAALGGAVGLDPLVRQADLMGSQRGEGDLTEVRQ
ncbi:hypothetical protein [Frankia sp. R82]|uniref:hypothetical protein n=1 Tax=Frankia sp. R82 TaxID=2950553 RepID=UPI002043040B|nr:hypothetical protein [Frankia sp. R82]MCM3886113.1 hypothetical protein [Frankia sp. R82]